MEELVRKHLENVKVIEQNITGYIDGEENYKNLIRDIDNLTGGFVISQSHKQDSKKLLWTIQSQNSKLSVDFFGSPFRSISNHHLDCVHGGEKKEHKQIPDVSPYQISFERS